jgi:hypothetical protein
MIRLVNDEGGSMRNPYRRHLAAPIVVLLAALAAGCGRGGDGD